MSFWGELRRRNVFKVGVAYAIVAWLIIQIVSTCFPTLQLPEWSVTLVTVLVIIGFPFALLFAWAFEITPDGIKLTKEVPRAESITRLTGQKLNYVVTALLVVAVAFLALKVYLDDRRAIEPDVATTETEQAPAVKDVEETQKTIAVLPFVDLSPEKDQGYFVDGLSEELLNSLSQIPDLLVTARTSSFTFKGSDKTVQEIASILGVENILEGSVRKAGNALRITAQLVRATDGFHLFSKTYDRELKDIFAVQEDIANAVADELSETLGIERFLRLLGETDNLDAYELYLVSIGQSVNFEYSRALESIDAAIALDPGFAGAWAVKSTVHLLLAQVSSADRASLELDAALEAALRAIELEPSLRDAYIQLGAAHSFRGEFIEAELAYRKAMDLTTESIGSLQSILHYTSLGYLRKCDELLEEMRRNDPFAQIVRAAYMLNLGYLGDMDRAEEEYERGKAIFEDQWIYGDIDITMLRLGAKDVLSINEIPEVPIFDPIWAIVREHIESPEEGLAELRRLYSSDDNLSSANFFIMACFAAYFGDPEFALNAMERSVSLQTTGLYWIWAPVMREGRQLPRFKEFVREIGLVDYWNEFGWPDICRQLDEGDFECD